MSSRPAGYWVTHSAVPKSVSTSGSASSARPSSDPCGSDSFSRVLSPLRSIFAVSPCCPSQGRYPAFGFLPSSRHHRRCPLAREFFRAPTTFRPQVFSTSRRFAPPSALQAYCIPQPRPGLLRSGGSPEPQPSWLVASPCPLAVAARALTGRNRLPRPCAPTSRPCSAIRRVPPGR